MIKIKSEGQCSAVETVNEIFIDDEIIYDYKKPALYKSSVNYDKSFDNSEYWTEQLKKHPLPSAISPQLTKINENKNTY